MEQGATKLQLSEASSGTVANTLSTLHRGLHRVCWTALLPREGDEWLI